mmetsp:Transcript_7914/g.20155  ORF Transcript_7914/g.20155 Transcript_7914/m.20155 type:complete len:80 (-) Transcript_7914:335-574(-)
MQLAANRAHQTADRRRIMSRIKDILLAKCRNKLKTTRRARLESGLDLWPVWNAQQLDRIRGYQPVLFIKVHLTSFTSAV